MLKIAPKLSWLPFNSGRDAFYMNELFHTNVTSRIVYLEPKYLYSAMNVSDMYF